MLGNSAGELCRLGSLHVAPHYLETVRAPEASKEGWAPVCTLDILASGRLVNVPLTKVSHETKLRLWS